MHFGTATGEATSFAILPGTSFTDNAEGLSARVIRESAAAQPGTGSEYRGWTRCMRTSRTRQCRWVRPWKLAQLAG